MAGPEPALHDRTHRQERDRENGKPVGRLLVPAVSYLGGGSADRAAPSVYHRFTRSVFTTLRPRVIRHAG
ncbi:hypothetical protein MTBSS4_280013 [Magnetospirillum sp. SS-4]|nr:hypothetical protein MTBSS4_280013 [Magnetospirillum sp. SS-4]